MKILILGGTGAIGSHVVRLLSEQYSKVFVTSRAKRESEENIIYLKGDSIDLPFLIKLLETKWDVIIDFMSYTSSQFGGRFDQLCNATNQYIFLSSARVYAESHSPLTEDSVRLLESNINQGYLETDEYALAKARQENLLRESKFTNWTIIRPYITYDKFRLQLGSLEKEEWLYRALHGRTIVFSSEMCEKITCMTSGHEVAKGIQAVIGPRFRGQTFNIMNENSVSWGQILEFYVRLLTRIIGREPRLLLQTNEGFMKWNSRHYQIIYDRMFDRYFDTSRIRRYLNTKSFPSFEVGLEKSLIDFVRNPQFKCIDWKQEAKKDKLTGEFSKLSEINGIKKKIKYIFYRFIKK